MEDKPGYYFTNPQGILFLYKCPECNTENYAPMVATGKCYRCGHDPRVANQKDKVDKD